MPSVYHASSTNDQPFTTCCRVAIVGRQQKCPSCKAYVYPFFDGMTEDDANLTEHTVDRMRFRRAHGT